MKTFFAMTAAVAALSLTAIDSADARGVRGGGGGGFSKSSIQAGPRVTAPAINPSRGPRVTPVINPNRVGPQVRPIRGPREGGRGINCGSSGTTQQMIINPRTGASETVTMASGPIRCTTRY